jgi:3-hydroxyacyl-[acyl-carrier-protein] dehydratase
MSATLQQTTLDIKDILKILPHRYPFLLVDKITEVDYDKGYIVGQKNMTMNELFFQGHFPNEPIMPGVLMIEALAQTGAVFIYLKGFQNKSAYLLNINNAKFRNPVRPGDILHLRCEVGHMSNKGGKFKAEAFVGEKTAAEAEIGFVLVDKPQQ